MTETRTGRSQMKCGDMLVTCSVDWESDTVWVQPTITF